MKTVSQMARQSKINRQRIYRYIKKHKIKEAGMNENKVRIYTDQAAADIIKRISTEDSSPAAYQLAVDQLAKKDSRIDQLQQALANEQLLTATAQKMLQDSKNEQAKEHAKLLEMSAKQDQADKQAQELEQAKQRAADLAKQNQEQQKQIDKMKHASWLSRLLNRW